MARAELVCGQTMTSGVHFVVWGYLGRQKLPTWERALSPLRIVAGCSEPARALCHPSSQGTWAGFRPIAFPQATEVGGGLYLGLHVSLKWVVLEHVFDLHVRVQKRAATHCPFWDDLGLPGDGSDGQVGLYKIPKALGSGRVWSEQIMMVPVSLPMTLDPVCPWTHWPALAKVLAVNCKGIKREKDGSPSVQPQFGPVCTLRVTWMLRWMSEGQHLAQGLHKAWQGCRRSLGIPDRRVRNLRLMYWLPRWVYLLTFPIYEDTPQIPTE